MGEEDGGGGGVGSWVGKGAGEGVLEGGGEEEVRGVCLDRLKTLK